MIEWRNKGDRARFQGSGHVRYGVSGFCGKHKQNHAYLLSLLLIFLSAALLVLRTHFTFQILFRDATFQAHRYKHGAPIPKNDLKSSFNVIAFLDDRDQDDSSFLIALEDAGNKHKVSDIALVRHIPYFFGRVL